MHQAPVKKIIVGITGASGVALGERFARSLPEGYEAYIIPSENARVAAAKECGIVLDDSDISECTASGSFGADMMVVIPCSMNTLAKISCGIADNLITRSAAVIIKERKTLLLAPRELPFSPIALENMHKLSAIGVIIAPPTLGFYANIRTLEEMEDFLIGRWFDLLGIPNQLYQRWGTR
jgi:4-hydroxy-3-polyprenylbenzoate decarboxylase